GFLFAEKCPAPPRIEFADATAQVYALGTEMYYECDSGYDRWSGDHPGIKCKRENHRASWSYSGFKCIDETILLSTAPTVEIEFTQKSEIKTRSLAPQKQEDLSEFAQKDFCGPPKTLPHASIKLKKHYYVGQELHFKCQSGYDKQPPISGTSTCEKVKGSIIWTPLNMRCANDT
ncbi:IL2RA protein, partial [Scytalopus superciliaris]|nr:IL2RA protein [Scytalopus superciliaris]